MIYKPNFAAVLLSFAGLVLALLIAVLPSPPGVWEAVEPVSYSRYVLRHTDFFTGALSEHSGTGVAQPTRAFRTLLAARDRHSSLRFLADSASPAGRLYALAGMTIIDPAAARALRTELIIRTDSVAFIRGCEDLVWVSVASLVPLASDSGFVAELRDADPSCHILGSARTG